MMASLKKIEKAKKRAVKWRIIKEATVPDSVLVFHLEEYQKSREYKQLRNRLKRKKIQTTPQIFLTPQPNEK